MKHEDIRPSHSDVPVPGLRDADMEARVFKNMEAKRKAWEKERDSSVVLYQFPDDRSAFQRLTAWWHRRTYRLAPDASGDVDEAMVEPVWQGHWATTKYL